MKLSFLALGAVALTTPLAVGRAPASSPATEPARRHAAGSVG